MNAKGLSQNATDFLMPDTSKEWIQESNLDSIQKFDISPDCKLAFFSCTAYMIFCRRGIFSTTSGPSIYLNVFSGYCKKLEDQWKLAWIQQTQLGDELEESDLIKYEDRYGVIRLN